MSKKRLEKKEIIQNIADERFLRHLSRKKKKKLEKSFHHLTANEKSIRLSNGIESFCNKNNITTWGKKSPHVIRINETSTLFENPEKLFKSLLKILYNAKYLKEYPKIHFTGRVCFSSLYLMDNMCWEISRRRKWEFHFENMNVNDQNIYSKLRSFHSSEHDDDDSYMLNEKVIINRSDAPMAKQQYLVKSKQITDMVIKAIQENDNSFKLSSEAYQAIYSTIGEHFDNILLHAPKAEFGYLCGFYDKKLHELSILIYNFGNTISETITQTKLPVEIQKEINDVIDNHTKKKNFDFFSKSFTEENAITLLALQEGISSRLIYDTTRGHGWIDYIEHCFELSIDCKISLISGNTAIKIDNKYKVGNSFFIDRERRMLALNDSNDIYQKPDGDYVKNMGIYFPGLIIETKIPLQI